MAEPVPKSMVFYSPSPNTYAVMRLNPVEMVRHLDDPIALAEAQDMRTKPHLIMLDMEMALPFPDRPWYRFEVHSIAPCLRDEEPQRGLTSDMCTPIFPNTHHPHGRAPVQPDPEGQFPYTNCYHWFQPVETMVRVRARPEKFDETNAVSLSPFARVGMRFSSEEEDASKMCANLDALEAATLSSETDSPSATRASPFCPDLPTISDTMLDSNPDRALQAVAVDRPEEDSVSTYSGSGSTESVEFDEYSDYGVDDLGPIDPFSAPDEDVELVPLVDLWVSELADHLKQEDIPHPSELLAEVEHLTGIVQRSRVRTYAALTAPPNAATSNTSQLTKRKHFRPAKTWTKLWSGVKRVAVRLKSHMHAPSLPLWP